MPMVERVIRYCQCAVCGHEWLPRKAGVMPAVCSACNSRDWLGGERALRPARVVRTVGQRRRALQESPAAALRIVKTLERTLERMPRKTSA